MIYHQLNRQSIGKNYKVNYIASFNHTEHSLNLQNILDSIILTLQSMIKTTRALSHTEHLKNLHSMF